MAALATLHNSAGSCKRDAYRGHQLYMQNKALGGWGGGGGTVIDTVTVTIAVTAPPPPSETSVACATSALLCPPYP